MLGKTVHWRTAPAPLVTTFSVAFGQINQPFTARANSFPVMAALPASGDALPAVLVAVWTLGFAGLACFWWLRWRQVAAAVRAGSIEQLGLPVRTISSPLFLEPGVFGVFRPVLLLPEGISERLTPAQLESVLAHELCHVRHRDNFIAFIQMFVESVFWFHPLVWWIGRRIFDERERACDEEVLRLGNEPRIYAQSILKICELYLESPAPCVAGVTGANLRKRIEAILSNSVPSRLNFPRQAALAFCAAVACVIPVAIGIWNAPAARAQSPAQVSAFEVASVKANHSAEPPNSNFPLGPGDVYVRNGGYFSATGYPLQTYITFAFKMTGDQIRYVTDQLPDWAKTVRYDIQARVQGNPGKDDMRAMMRSLLADRFKMKTHYEDREVPVFAMMLLAKSGKTGRELRPHAETSDCPTEQPSASTPGVVRGAPAFCNGIYQLPPTAGGQIRFGGRNVTLGFIGDTFGAGAMGRPMIDQTGLSGRFDFTLEWTQERPGQSPPGANAQTEPAGVSFEDALRDQLGIKLQARKGPVSILVIDHVERATEN
jgi:uncharacterized protein (TIGR03435 family)